MAATATNFVMRGAREAMAGGFAHIEEQVKGIEWAVAENPCLAFDLSKTLIESICRTILTERDINFSRKDDLLRLFRKVKQHLPFLPPDASHVVEIRRSLDQTLNGLHTAIQGICELRNKCGYASHGSSEPQPSIESVQAFLAAEAADTIVGFLHRIHRQDRAPGAQHYFHKDGHWYEVLDRFPGVYWDNRGYIVFQTEDAYRNCSQLSIDKKCNVEGGGPRGKGISGIFGYVRVEGIPAYIRSLVG